ncbi:hypothetical protein BH09BAC2_BH09BAC2_18200 [soil metagenome]
MKKGLLLLCLLPAFNNLSAQLCNGSLGDPIINKTFGAGPDPGTPLAAATTNYLFTPQDCPPDGSYTIRTNTTNCFDQTWHSLTQDHTGNANGYIMIVNASYEKGDFYLDTVHGLCGNTTYEFASWILNLNSSIACATYPAGPIKPNLTFSIETLTGLVIQQYNTGDISRTSTPVWNQYGFFFKTPVSIFDVVVRITNNAPGGCGNDIALDDITFRPCGPLIQPSIQGSSNNATDVCLGQSQSVILNSTTSAGFNNPYYQWQVSNNAGQTWTDIPGANNTSCTINFTPASPTGDYYFRIAAAETGNYGSLNCRIVSTILILHVHPKPTTSATNSGPVCRGETLTLSATGGTTYSWSGNGFSGTGAQVSISNIQPSQAGKYYVTVTDAQGCSALDSTTVSINNSPTASVAVREAMVCAGESVTLGASGGRKYIWSPSTTLSATDINNPIALPTSTTNYRVVVFNSLNCTDTAYTNIIVLEAPVVNAGPDLYILPGTSITLKPSVSGSDLSFVWNPATFLDNSTIKNPTVTGLQDTITYTLTVNNITGCKATDDVKITVIKQIIIPNTFTPNNDGVNDKWMIGGLESYYTAKVKVFNRYGQVVFESIGYSNPWDGSIKGKGLPIGTYYYIVEPAPGIKGLTGYVTILK